MMRIRPARTADLNSLMDLAGKTGAGLTTLPEDRKILEDKITQSNQAFASNPDSPGLEYYLFFLEDTDSKKIVGCSALAATVGLSEAFYTYHQGTVVHTSERLNVHNVIDVLYMGNDYTGTTEICTLFLDPEYRKNGNGQLLSKCRFLFMAEQRQRFADKVIAEMRGYSDENANSPFWDAIGSHFFTMKYTDADALSGEGKNQFIAELMPRYPIYLSLLPEEARAVIGQTHPDTKPALKMLEREGFEFRGYVDIFDAGPTVEVKTNQIRTIKKSGSYQVNIISESECSNYNFHQFMLANTKVQEFRACYGEAVIENEAIKLTQSLANSLNVVSGDKIRALSTGR